MRGEPSDTPTAEPATVKYPKRFWWTKRLLVLYVLMAVGIVASRYIWLAIGNARVAEQVRQIEARGESLDWLGMEPPPIPAAINAAKYYERADGAITLTRDQGRMLDDLLDNRDFRAQHAADVHDILAANQTVFDECRVATPLKDVNWGSRHVRPGRSTMLPAIVLNRTLAKLLALRALRLVEQGRLAEAVQTFGDAEALARAMGANLGLIGHLVSVACHSLATTAIEELADQVGSDQSEAGLPPELRAALAKLIGELLDGHLIGSQVAAMSLERAELNDTVEWLMEDAPRGGAGGLMLPAIFDDRIAAWFLRPALRVDQARLLRLYRAYVNASGQSNAVLAQREGLSTELDSLAGSRNALKELATTLTSTLAHSLNKVSTLTHKTIAQRRMAATALALAMYRREHGNWPGKLEELVPEYLPAVPVDTFDPDGGPIRAVLNDGVPRLYSLGRDFKDQGGQHEPGNTRWDDPDIVVYLRASDRPQSEPTYTPAPPGGYGAGHPIPWVSPRDGSPTTRPGISPIAPTSAPAGLPAPGPDGVR